MGNAMDTQGCPVHISEVPNGRFKVGPKAGRRRAQVHSPGLRWLGIAPGSLLSTIRHNITLFRDPALSYFGALGPTRKHMFCHIFTPVGAPTGGPGRAPQPPLGHPGPVQAQSDHNGPGSHLDTPNGAFKVGPKGGPPWVPSVTPGRPGGWAALVGHSRVPFDTI